MNMKELMDKSSKILDAIYNGIVAVDNRGTVIYVNPANNRITGINREDAVGKHVSSVVPDSHILEVIKSGSEMIGVRTKTGKSEVISNIVPIRERGNLIGAISIFQDITDIIKLNRRLNEAQNTIAHLSQRLSQANEIDKDVIVGNNRDMLRVMQLAIKASGVSSNVLIQGESGTGKEVFARYIHRHSDRRDKPFVVVNCAAIPEHLLESELFGYEEGAFTGAKKGGRRGLFELADGGTIFLDEIGDMHIALQPKVLRVLQNGEIMRIGGTSVRHADVRVIAATNKNLKNLVETNRFREDLYYRLRVILIQLQPLRERKEDLHIFIKSITRKTCERLKKEVLDIAPAAMRVLMNYDYPGNVREMENIIEQSVVMDEDSIIDVDDLPRYLTGDGKEEDNLNLFFADRFPTLEEIEREVLTKAVSRYKNKTDIAKALNISRATLYRKLDKYDLDDV
ncbi:MAG: Response regulator of zinc sigma-54-dependent two-component system [Firmicutes bacterium]|nr:Response regulator of zinc sigma-54-dependent two-component system [Bacillota bacterium]